MGQEGRATKQTEIRDIRQRSGWYSRVHFPFGRVIRRPRSHPPPPPPPPPLARMARHSANLILISDRNTRSCTPRSRSVALSWPFVLESCRAQASSHCWIASTRFPFAARVAHLSRRSTTLIRGRNGSREVSCPVPFRIEEVNDSSFFLSFFLFFVNTGEEEVLILSKVYYINYLSKSFLVYM